MGWPQRLQLEAAQEPMTHMNMLSLHCFNFYHLFSTTQTMNTGR